MLELLAANIPALLSTLAAIIAAVIAYREKRANTEDEHARNLIDRLLTRTKDLESTIGNVQNDVYNARKESIDERRALIADYEARIDKLILEMRRAKDEMVIEISTWRDKYYTLLDDYQKLKMQHTSLDVKFNQLHKEYEDLAKKVGL